MLGLCHISYEIRVFKARIMCIVHYEVDHTNHFGYHPSASPAVVV